MSDLILFAKEYSRQLTYYNARNEQDGNWLPLMQMDVSVILATLGNQDMAGYRQLIRQQLQYLSNKKHATAPDLVERFSFLFDFTWSWLYELDTQLRLLPDGWPFKNWLTDVISSRLAIQRGKLNAWYQQAAMMGCVKADYDATAFLLPTSTVPFHIEHAGSLQAQKWESAWTQPPAAYSFHLQGESIAEKIRFAATNNLFTTMLDAIFKQGSMIANHAAQSLEEAVHTFPAHTPHYALFLTFLQLFRLAQEELNTFTGRHLDCYYRDVLQLSPAPAVPDATHLLVELQKNVKEYLLPAGFLFKAGKDAAGTPQFYATDKEVLLNQATVTDIRGITHFGPTHPQAGLYASPVANSADGLGAPLKAGSTWQPFGVAGPQTLTCNGFAIASPLLLMKEGSRKVVLTLKSNNVFPQNAAISNLRVMIQLTGASGWMDAVAQLEPEDPSFKQPSYQLKIIATLATEQEAVIPYNPALHGGNFVTAHPVMRLKFKPQTMEAALLLQQWTATALSEVQVNVQVNGVRQLNVFNEAGQLDISKPFQPFGYAPYAGSACIIGNNEIFMKPNVQVSLNIAWDKVPAAEGIVNHGSKYLPNAAGVPEPTTKPYSADQLKDASSNPLANTPVAAVEVLENGSWQYKSTHPLFSAMEYYGESLINPVDLNTLHTNFFTIYPKATVKTRYPAKVTFQAAVAQPLQYGENIKFQTAANHGFARLVLQADLGHRDYQQRFAFLAGKQQPLPPEPYTPLAKSITADYTATQTLKFGSAANPQFPGQFFSLHPFGEREENDFSRRDLRWTPLPASEGAGQLYIGLDKCQPETTVQLLFRVSEGSANPLLPSQPLRWQWLSNRGYWEDFSAIAVEDDTNGLLHTGIITFRLPATLAQGAPVMGGKHAWIRAVVAGNPDAISNLQAVDAQAIRVRWTDNNTGNAYTTPAPAGTIQQPLQPASPLKKIYQPNASTGGRTEETAAQFRMRVSERLRHKSRAITIWDYEHLVLEKFPEIYRVKCLNHSAATADSTREMAPGNIVIVPVPDITRMSAANPQRPLTSLDTLSAIEKYLKSISGSFVNIQVCNPVFEEVVISCEVLYKDGNTAFNTTRLLKDFRAFLSPWAYDNSVQPEFGGKISKSTLVNMLEGLPYVEYIINLKLFLRKDGVTILEDREEITTTSSRSMLVCAPDEVQMIIPVINNSNN